MTERKGHVVLQFVDWHVDNEEFLKLTVRIDDEGRILHRHLIIRKGCPDQSDEIAVAKYRILKWERAMDDD